jgi:DNA-binding transcriptional regulator YiaG
MLTCLDNLHFNSGMKWRKRKRAHGNAPKNESVRELRDVIGASQPQFGRLIGVTVDAVKNWEGGRNKVSSQMAKRIEIATGANPKDLIRGDGRLRVCRIIKQAWLLKNRPKRHDWDFTKQDYQDWTNRTGRPSEESIPYFFRMLSREILTVLHAAARAERGGTKGKCFTVFAAMGDAVQEVRNRFRLDPQVLQLMRQPDWGASGCELPPAIRRVFGRILQPGMQNPLGKPPKSSVNQKPMLAHPKLVSGQMASSGVGARKRR